MGRADDPLLAHFERPWFTPAPYNAGPERVARPGRVPDIEETRAYVVSVIDSYLVLAAARTARIAPQCQPLETGR